MNKKKDYIITIIFIAFITIPTVLYWFVGALLDNGNYENRSLSTKPTFTLNTTTSYPTNYENYYNDNLAFKNEIRKLRSFLLYHIFHTSSNSQVIIGKNNWLFYNISGDNTDTIADYRKTSSFSNTDKIKIKNKLKNIKNDLNFQNIDFYIFIAPNKETIYSEYMPNSIKVSNNKYSKTEELVKYINNNSDLNVMFPKEELISAKKKENTYYKYDTHWNNYGSYIGSIKLLKQIDSNFKEPKIKISYTTKSGDSNDNSGDLSTMNLMPYLRNNEPYIENFYDNIKYKCQNKNHENFTKCISDNYLYDKTLLFVGDSFRKSTIQYLAKIYKNSIFIHKDIYSYEMIQKYNPNIVIYETVERDSHSLLYNFN